MLLWTARGLGSPSLLLQASPALPPIVHTCMHRDLQSHTKGVSDSGQAGSTPQLPLSFIAIPQIQHLHYVGFSSATEAVTNDLS